MTEQATIDSRVAHELEVEEPDARIDDLRDIELYVAARLPNLVVATVGGGTALPTQRECLALLECVGDGTARKFAEIVGAALVAGELAICAALANGRFIEAHRQNRLHG
jgi:hydroxymethylglutaryl-CoA reductase (NADPH)